MAYSLRMAYSLQDERGQCLHAASYRIGRSLRRCIDAGDGGRCCGFQFGDTREWRDAKKQAERKKKQAERKHAAESKVTEAK